MSFETSDFWPVVKASSERVTSSFQTRLDFREPFISHLFNTILYNQKADWATLPCNCMRTASLSSSNFWLEPFASAAEKGMVKDICPPSRHKAHDLIT